MGAFWRGPLNVDTRFALAFYLGINAALVLMLLFSVPLYFMGSLELLSLWSRSTPLRAIYGFDQMGPAHEANRKVTMELYPMDWESPDVREETEAEKFGEEAYGEAHRAFIPMGTGTFLFTHFGTYRTGPSSFGVVGLVSRSLHMVYGSNPTFLCSWAQSLPLNRNSSSEQEPTSNTSSIVEFIIDGKMVTNGTANKYYVQDRDESDRMDYIAIVVECTFDAPVGIDGRGGELKMVADHGEPRKHTGLKSVSFVALLEQPGDYNESLFDEPFQYDYLYCGSPLYGKLNPHRVKEWIAYHMRLFGKNSHFIFYDVGGIDDVIWEVLKPWVQLRQVSIMNVRQQERYSAHLFNQFLLANDCLLRAKTLAKWTFFFDIDEYLHVTKDAHLETSFHDVMAEMTARGRNATAVYLEQRAMNHFICLRDNDSVPENNSQWAIEKLVYQRNVTKKRDSWPSHWHDFKCIVQAKYVSAMGVHLPAYIQVPEGKWQGDTETHLDFQDCENCYENKMHYYHYRQTSSILGDLCEVYMVPANESISSEWGSYLLDTTMVPLGAIVREFENRTIGEISLN